MKKLSIDRFEGIYAFLQDDEGKMFAIPVEEMPAGAKEGDRIVISDEGELSVDTGETESRRKAAAAKQKKVLKKK